MAASDGEDVDMLGFHQEGRLLAVDLFHLRRGQTVDRREFFWEDIQDFKPQEFFASLLQQLYLDQQYLPDEILVPLDFEDRAVLEELLSEKRGHAVHVVTPGADAGAPFWNWWLATPGTLSREGFAYQSPAAAK